MGKTFGNVKYSLYLRHQLSGIINVRIMEKILKRANEILGTNYLNWRALSRHNRLTEDFIREFKDKVDWYFISAYHHLSEDFIREFEDKVNWVCISEYQHLSEDFIREFKDKVDWDFISVYQHLSEDFIREFEDKVNWVCISVNQRLSEEFIREFKGKVYWVCISECQHLSEDFIRAFKDNVSWGWISMYQRLSEDFIREFADRVDWYRISTYQYLSKEFIEEFKDRLYMRLITNSWHYISTEEKKKAVMDTGLYECHEDYFIAYKGIRSDRCSRYNFQYQYLKGEIYETWCDCSDSEDSFGFSAWTEDEARKYCNELVVRVKVRYEDVGRVVHDGGKIRCFKLEILD